MALNMIIGFGNPLRQDDALGLRATEMLDACGIETVRCHQLTPELAAQIGESEIAIFLDAAISLRPGLVQCTEVIAEEAPAPWTHYLTPAQLLGLTAQLYGTAPRALLITGGPFSLDFGEGLSIRGRQCAQQMAALALRAISNPELHPGGVETLGHDA